MRQWWTRRAGMHLVELGVLFCGTASKAALSLSFSLFFSLSLHSPRCLPSVCLTCETTALGGLPSAARGGKRTPRAASRRAESTKFSKRHSLYHRRAGARRNMHKQCSSQMPVAGIQMGPLTGRRVGTRMQSSALAGFVLLHFTGSCYS